MDLPIGAPDSYIQGRSIFDAKREHFLTILRKKGLVAPLAAPLHASTGEEQHQEDQPRRR